MEPMYVMATWAGDPLAGQLVFGSGGPLICALVAALVGTMLAVLRERGGSGSRMDDLRPNARHNPLTTGGSHRNAA